MQNLNIFYVIDINLNYKLLANLKGQKQWLCIFIQASIYSNEPIYNKATLQE